MDFNLTAEQQQLREVFERSGIWLAPCQTPERQCRLPGRQRSVGFASRSLEVVWANFRASRSQQRLSACVDDCDSDRPPRALAGRPREMRCALRCVEVQHCAGSGCFN